jgi:hypothetical protein
MQGKIIPVKRDVPMYDAMKTCSVLNQVRSIKTYWEVEVQLPAFLTSVLDGSEWSGSRPGRFIPGIHRLRGWLNPTDGMDAVGKREISLLLPYRESKHVHPARSLVTTLTELPSLPINPLRSFKYVATYDLYLQYGNIMISEICKIGKNTFGKQSGSPVALLLVDFHDKARGQYASEWCCSEINASVRHEMRARMEVACSQ